MEFWKGVFSDNGSPSFSRAGTGFALVAAVVWVSYLVWVHKSLPDFSGLIMFIGTLYALNVSSAAVGRFSGQPKQ